MARGDLIRARVSAGEAALIAERAESYGMTVSEYLRHAAIGHAPGPLGELATAMPAADLVANVLWGTSGADAEMIRRAAVGSDAERDELLTALLAHTIGSRGFRPDPEYQRAFPHGGRDRADYFARVIAAARSGIAPQDALSRDHVQVCLPETPPHPDWRAEAELGRRLRDDDIRAGRVPGSPSDLSRMTPKARTIFEEGAAILAAEAAN